MPHERLSTFPETSAVDTDAAAIDEVPVVAGASADGIPSFVVPDGLFARNGSLLVSSESAYDAVDAKVAAIRKYGSEIESSRFDSSYTYVIEALDRAGIDYHPRLAALLKRVTPIHRAPVAPREPELPLSTLAAVSAPAAPVGRDGDDDFELADEVERCGDEPTGTPACALGEPAASVPVSAACALGEPAASVPVSAALASVEPQTEFLSESHRAWLRESHGLDDGPTLVAANVRTVGERIELRWPKHGRFESFSAQYRPELPDRGKWLVFEDGREFDNVAVHGNVYLAPRAGDAVSMGTGSLNHLVVADCPFAALAAEQLGHAAVAHVYYDLPTAAVPGISVDGCLVQSVQPAVNPQRCIVTLIAATEEARDYLASQAVRIPSVTGRSCASVEAITSALDFDLAAAAARYVQLERERNQAWRQHQVAAKRATASKRTAPRTRSTSERSDGDQEYAPPPMPAEITLSERHREMLRASCLTDETVAARRLFTMTDSDADREWLARAVNWKAWPKKMGGALVFPMFRPGESEPYAYRPRPDSPIVEKKPNGKKRERKYENPKNGPRCVDFGEPCDVDKYRSESVQRVFWTEGEKKRLYLSQLGYLTVGLTGVTNWNETGTTNLNAAIKQHVRLDCEHTIVFDCPKHGEKRSDEAREMRKLAQALLGTGAPRVRGVFVRDAQAKGVDDYGKKYGDAAVRALIDNAPDVDLGKVDAQVSGWQNELRVNEGDEVLATVDNIECILRNDDRWYGRLVYNERAMRMEVALGSPVQQPGDDGLRALNLDVDAARIASWLGREYELNIDPSSRKLLGAIVTVAHERGYDPFRDWLMSLKWDGVPRLDRWLVDYSEAADTPLHEAFASKFLVSAVARTIEPGTKVDTALILEGPQGAHKSQLLAALVPRSEWFSDDLPADLQNKDAKQHLLGKVLCELSELDALRGSRAETLKAFLARSVDQYRPPYGRSDVHQPRRVVFAGTTNDVEYLQDSTGARRFWPVKVARCNPAGLAAVREQLWAEARVRYERRSVTKETWWFDKDDLLLRRAEDAQLTRSERDPWHDRIETFVCEAVQSPGYLAMDEVLARLGVETRDQNASHSKRVKRLLASLGWTRQRPKIKGVRRWVYRPAGLEQADDNKNDDFVA